jgi:hypothetical protein
MTEMIQRAMALTEAVDTLKAHVREYFYQVVLVGYACPHCCGGLEMVAEGTARCLNCGRQFDPTIAFQQCDHCGGQLKLAVRRYQCSQCGVDVSSRFLFEGLVFNTAYFCQKMAESRKRKQELRERVRLMLADSRSDRVNVPGVDQDRASELMNALDSLVKLPDASQWERETERFDLGRYQSHIQAHLQQFPVSLADIPPLSEKPRKDLIWRFIAVIFLAHAGSVELWQEGTKIMVMQRETDPEGQGVPGDLEAADRYGRAVC